MKLTQLPNHSSSPRKRFSPPFRSGRQWLLDPKEWDFRFVRPEELHVATVYEYARSCPWIRTIWEPWLNEPASIPASNRRTQSKIRRRRIRDIIRTHLDSPTPIWDRATDEARAVALRCPSILEEASLDYLVYCTPSFPATWAELPVEEQTAALSLLPGSLSLFRDAEKPTWAAPNTYSIAVEIKADIVAIRAAADLWLARKKQEHEDAYRKRAKVGASISTAKKTWNPGRAAAPRREALTWLGAYRFKEAGISLTDASLEINRRQAQLKDPSCKKFPKLCSPNMDDSLWRRYYRKAQWLMVAMFKRRIFLPPSCKLPGLRWAP
jgi:hypothetical protein